MTYRIGYLWKEFKILWCFVFPYLHLLCSRHLVKSSIQLYAVKLSGIVGKLILCTFGVKVLKVGLVPLGTANGYIQLLFTCFKYLCCFFSVWRKFKIYI